METILNLVTNRSNNFQSPILNFESGYRARRETSEEIAIRKLLRLEVGNPDYFVIGVLQAINAFPEIKRTFPQDGVEFYDLSKWRKPATSFESGKLIPSRQGPPWIKRVADSWPVSFLIELKYITGDAGLVRCGAFSEIVTVRTGTDADDYQLVHLDWPTKLSMNGTAKFNNLINWAPGTVLKIYHTPANFPYGAVVRSTQYSVEKNRLLVSQGLMAQYFSAQSDTEKVALLGLALALSTLQHG